MKYKNLVWYAYITIERMDYSLKGNYIHTMGHLVNGKVIKVGFETDTKVF